MKLLVKVIFILISTSAMMLIAALFVQKEVSIEHSIELNKTVADVYDYVKHIDAQKDYSAWQSKSTQINLSNNPEDGYVGHVSPHELDMGKMGKGRLKITQLDPNKKVVTQFLLTDSEPRYCSLTMTLSTTSLNESSTKLSWKITSSASYPFNITLLFSKLENTLGAQLEESVKTLKIQLESQ